MASAAIRYLLCVLVLSSVTVFSSQAVCTSDELNEVFSCITPYGQLFGNTFGFKSVDNSVCNTSKITTDICQAFGNIVTCINGLNVSLENCLNSAEQVNAGLDNSCRVEDFSAACTDATSTGGLDTTSVVDTTTTTTTNNNNSNGCGGKVVTLFLLMPSLMTTFLVLMM